jgi:hypothetical protein
MARETQRPTVDYTFANPTPSGLRLIADVLIAERLEEDQSGSRRDEWAAENVRRLADVWESSLLPETNDPVRLGELVSGERMLMRRAIGILSDMQRLEREIGSVLDAFASGAAILHNTALRLAGELETLRNGTTCDGIRDPDQKIKG